MCVSACVFVNVGCGMYTYFLFLASIILKRTVILREKRKKPLFCEYYGKGIDNQISNVSLTKELCVIGQNMCNWR